MRIELTDNNICLHSGRTYDRRDVSALFPIAGKTVAELCRENRHLLVFPYDIESSDDRIGDSSVLAIDNTEDPDKVRVSTGNVLGFIGVGNLKLRIRSRFEEGDNDYFLHYMLQKVMSFNLFELNYDNDREEVFNFLVYMFPYFLKSALRQGIYGDYRQYGYNDSRVRGPIDVCRFIRRDIPFSGNVAYSARELSYDNDMTQLVRHTIEYISVWKYGQSILNLDTETKENVRQIISSTPSYDRQERGRVILKNLRLAAHPYFTEYKALQILCVQILRSEEVKYGEGDEEICGILFDGAWLWEEYLATLLKGLGFRHPKNRLGKGGIYLFEDIDESGRRHRSGIRYPDFYKEGMVLDAKYKRLGDCGKVSKVGRDDLHQLVTYMHNLKSGNGGFVVPLENKQVTLPFSRLKGSASGIYIFGIEVAKGCRSYDEFRRRMQENERRMIEQIAERC